MSSTRGVGAVAGTADQVADAGAPANKPSGQEAVEVGRGQLPHYCPPPGSALWNAHPRVYLPLAEAGEARCPYCGALYRLVEGGNQGEPVFQVR